MSFNAFLLIFLQLKISCKNTKKKTSSNKFEKNRSFVIKFKTSGNNKINFQKNVARINICCTFAARKFLISN